MALLIITTILWAFSFSLIGEYLAGSVDSYFSVLMRVGLAALVFLPFLRTRGQSPRTIVLYMLVGAMQLGIMYLLAFRAYIYLTVSEFLLFTVFTPLYITLIYDLLSGRKLRWGYLLSAALAVLGAAIIRYDKVSDHFWTGLLLVQLSNLCFAIGMVGYKRLMEVRPDAAAQCLCLVLCRGLYRGGGGVVYARQRPEAADHHAAVERAGVARRGGFRAGLLYVELWRHPGGCRHAGDHE
ncbi:transporter 10 TMS drug/metabolite exporter (DME) family [Klebsiella pneumoniae]|uniref:Transporter 10 TMS drug/metabolite exporter (DME) family n=1 Tax=Klebsiella pneumoniae TaxID=573 RepID=A0A377WAV6_KLEPN|nr:transporter 10 TMS drug/metabolite exporter (DME) family [Klebsiella pneumoniae]